MSACVHGYGFVCLTCCLSLGDGVIAITSWHGSTLAIDDLLKQRDADLTALRARLALADCVVDLVRAKTCCEGADAETTRDCLLALSAYDAALPPPAETAETKERA